MSNTDETMATGTSTNTGTQAIPYTNGTFCWWDLGTTDVNGAKAFYGGLLGWEAVDMPISEGEFYTMFRYNGKDVAGAYKLGAEQQAQGIPTNWCSYVWADNVDEVAAKVTANGGTLLMAPMDVMEVGRMALLQDPTGAVLGLWQPGTHRGAGHLYQVGGNCWNELMTNDTQKAGDFYTAVLGWEINAQQMGPMTYYMIRKDGQDKAGMMAIDPAWGEVPANWMPYFTVENCDASVAKVESLGGKVMQPGMDIPGVGRMALIVDPQGGHVSIIQLAAN